MKNVVTIWHYFGLNYRLKLKENIIYLSFQPLNHPFDAAKSFWLKALANSWAFSRRIGPLIGMLLPRIDVNHFSKASFNFSYVPVFTLCRFSDEFWKASKIFSLFFFQAARVLPGILNWFAASLLGLPFEVILMLRTLLLKSLHPYRVSHQQSSSNKFKDLDDFSNYVSLN